MKKASVFFIIISASLAACTKIAAPDNSSPTNANSPAAVSSDSNQANAGVKTQETPLPVFTDASEAVAAGDKLFDASDNEKAIAAYRQAVKLNPDLAEAYFKLGMAYSLLEKEQKDAGVAAEEPTPAPKKKGKKDVPAKLTEADKAFENAVKAYKKILEKNPKDDAAQFNLGRAYNKLNEDTDAQKALTQAVKLKPDDGLYQTELGAILIKLAKYEDAVPALKKALVIDADNLQAQELLEKAQAGKKRIDFGLKPKLPPTPQAEQAKSRGTPKPPESPKPKDEPTLEKKNANQQPKPAN